MSLIKNYFKGEKYSKNQNNRTKNLKIKAQRPSYNSKTIHNWAKRFKILFHEIIRDFISKTEKNPRWSLPKSLYFDGF